MTTVRDNVEILTPGDAINALTVKEARQRRNCREAIAWLDNPTNEDSADWEWTYAYLLRSRRAARWARMAAERIDRATYGS